MNRRTLLIRCDAHAQIGAGHFFRQLALAQAALTRELRPLIVMANPDPVYPDIAAESGVEVLSHAAAPASPEDAAELRKLARSTQALALVVDGYRFDPAYYEAVHSADHLTVAVDDIAHQRFPVDLLVNVNPSARDLDYDLPVGATALLGVEFALLRRQFGLARSRLDASGGPDAPADVTRILITLGGSDPTNATSLALRALHLTGYTGAADVVIGPSNPHRASLDALATTLGANIRLHTHIRHMAELMDGQHLAICAGGGTSWELACLGVPMLQIILADNQRRSAAWLQTHGISSVAGDLQTLSLDALAASLDKLLNAHQTRAQMIAHGLAMIDGRGPDRVLDVLLDLTHDRHPTHLS